MTTEISELRLDDLELVSGGMYIPWDVYVSVGMGGSLSSGGSAGAPTGIGAGGVIHNTPTGAPPRTVVNPVIQRYARIIRGGKSAWDIVTEP
ncbi:hypothetical protein [Microvirga puerhi]|uniref:Bacteriocin n=1 Tax=Microvirga puerhi TaxID=2876078 RepID=A0ABS7VIC0_9HYPH|nr:hypothetical protein [Microvirga puerhi]MBZ6074767.1 hypothetical protein [Microvirga puerhi]